MTHRVYLALGSNLGHKLDNLQKAKNEISLHIGEIISVADYYETEPWGFENEHWFLNTVIEIETTYSAMDTLKKCLEIEKNMGRTRNTLSSGYSSRIIDIDLLFFDDEIINSAHLSVPHPHIPNRKFVLLPLSDIAGSLVHPLLKKSVNVLLKECTDNTQIKKLHP